MSKISSILVVDDEPSIPETLSIVFPEFSFQQVESAEAAMEILDKDPSIDLMILDYKLPGKNGVEVAKDLKAKDPNLRTIMISGYPDIEQEAMSNGVRAFIPKPIDFDDLQEVIWSMMDNRL